MGSQEGHAGDLAAPIQAVKLGSCFFGTVDGFACSLLWSFALRPLDDPAASSDLSHGDNISSAIRPKRHILWQGSGGVCGEAEGAEHSPAVLLYGARGSSM